MAKLGGVEVKVRESLLRQVGSKVLSDSQTRMSPDATEPAYAGELRGYYPYAAWPWRPGSSTFGNLREGGHRGVDIYAPYFEYPLETPVFALCSGRMTTRSDTLRGDGNELGNFIALVPSDGPNGPFLEPTKFLYGHLNRFHGRSPRDVKLGELIGYAGCSGNADGSDECSKAGSRLGSVPYLNINSGHVHLKYERPTKPGAKTTEVADPLLVLGWKLRFDPTTAGPLAKPLATRMHAKDWGPYQLDKAPQRNHAVGWMYAQTQQPQRPAKRPAKEVPKDAASVPVADPCGLIDIDNEYAIDLTRRAYRLAQERLSASKPDTKDKDTWKESMEEVGRLHTRLEQRVASVELVPEEAQQPKPAEEKSAAVLHFLLEAHRVLWLALAGRVVLRLLRGQPDSDAVPDGGVVPDSGVASNGFTFAIAMDQGQSALHMTRLQKADGTLRSWTASVTFGAGTEWHAVLDSSLREGLAGQPEALKFFDGLEFLVLRLLRLHRFAAMNHRLINQREPGSIRVLTSFMRIVAEAVGVLSKANLSEEAWESFARALFVAAEQACESALLSFNPANKATVRRTPLVSMLALTNDKAAGGVEPDIPAGG